MRPRQQRDDGQIDLLRARLDQILNMDHPLVKLAAAIDWGFLDKRLGEVYDDDPGRPPLPSRLMAGLAILKAMHDLSDEDLCERWLENPITNCSAARRSSSIAWPSSADALAPAHGRGAASGAAAGEPGGGDTAEGGQAGRLPRGDRRHHRSGESHRLPDRRQAVEGVGSG